MMLQRGCKYSRASGAAIAVRLVWRDKDAQMMRDEALGDEAAKTTCRVPHVALEFSDL